MLDIWRLAYFYSHASCEARHAGGTGSERDIRFLLTRLLRGATDERFSGLSVCLFLLTRLLRGATPMQMMQAFGRLISTHTPLARRDTVRLFGVGQFLFLLTRLLRGATFAVEQLVAAVEISTHTPLARRDSYI